MPTIEIGAKPQPVSVVLATGGDFEAELTLRDAAEVAINWPTGTTLTLVFADGTTWAATIAGATATWNVDKATADTRPNAQKVRLIYVNGSTDRVLWSGRVQRHG